MDNKEWALIGIEVYFGDGEKKLKSFCRELMSFSKILKISSVYRVKPEQADHLPSDRFKSFGRLSLAVLVETGLEPLDMLNRLHEIEERVTEIVVQRTAKSYLLLWENQVVMSPQVTLPYPKFHTKPQILVPAAEIAGHLNHPILDSTLSKLSTQIKNTDWGVFHVRGKTLLDFSG